MPRRWVFCRSWGRLLFQAADGGGVLEIGADESVCAFRAHAGAGKVYVWDSVSVVCFNMCA